MTTSGPGRAALFGAGAPAGSGERASLLDNLRPATTHRTGLLHLGATYAARPMAVATGYLNLGGLSTLAAVSGDGRGVRLLLGATPAPGLGSVRSIGEWFEEADEELRQARNFGAFPPSRAEEHLLPLRRWLEQPQVEARRYRGAFLHGKAYLFGDAARGDAAVVTSANLTAAGMQKNRELGLVEYNPERVGKAIDWFDRLWVDGEDFKAALLKLLAADPLILLDPQRIFMRVLLDLFGEESEAGGGPEPNRVELAKFQLDGFHRALRIVDRCGGVIYADGVGTGKTEIGLAFVEEYAVRRQQHALVVAPAQLVETWGKRLKQCRLPAEVLSFQQLADDEQVTVHPERAKERLAAPKDSYRLVVVDEAHAFRNPDTGWHRALSRLLGGKPKHAVLLTATPINNGLMDLFHLVMAFARHDSAYAHLGIRSLRGVFKAAGARSRDAENLDPDLLFPLADLVSVRRDRQFIEEQYPNATFPDGTPVRFPTPKLETRRYDLDLAWPGIAREITDAVRGLTLARYRPSAYRKVAPEKSLKEEGLACLLQSAILKRFESCHDACRRTVERMERAHRAFLAAWDAGEVLEGEDLKRAIEQDLDETGAAAWLSEQPDDGARLPAGDFREELREEAAADHRRLRRILERLEALDPADDPKLELLRRLVASSGSRKIIVFSTFADTVRYLEEQLPEELEGRRRAVVIGAETTPDERTAELGRFAPKSVLGRDTPPPPGEEVDLLFTNDVLSEGQNLQQAAAVISYDLPWNPQRVVQRYGRVIRLKSEHDEVFLTTMLPAPGDLEPLLRLESAIRRKLRAAELYGLEVGVLEEAGPDPGAAVLRFADRLARADPTLLDERDGGGLDEAFGGESLRRRFHQALMEGEITKLKNLPWGAGAAIRLPSSGVLGGSEREPGVFFACRTRQMDRYWRFVPGPRKGDGKFGEAPPEPDALHLRRIDPGNAPGIPEPKVDLETSWRRAAESIVAEHNELADQSRGDAIGPRQKWAVSVLRRPAHGLSAKIVGRAAKALLVGRSNLVRKRLGEIERAFGAKTISLHQAARRIVELVDEEGLREATPPEPLKRISGEQDLGVVCWMALLPSA